MLFASVAVSNASFICVNEGKLNPQFLHLTINLVSRKRLEAVSNEVEEDEKLVFST